MDLQTINIISGIFLVVSAFTLIVLLVGQPAAYGKYLPKNRGVVVNAKMAWCIQELPSWIIPLLLLLFSGAPKATMVPNTILTLMMVVHYIQRTCVYPFLIRGGKPLPIEVTLCAIVLCTINGYLQPYYILYYGNYGEDWWTKPHFILGVVIFFLGMGINLHSDHILRNLRKPGETGYKVPYGGLFDFVSGANFFGEIVEWTGFAVATWSIPALAFAIFTFCNIGPRAIHHHRYYIEKFEDYPEGRKALIPFLF